MLTNNNTFSNSVSNVLKVLIFQGVNWLNIIVDYKRDMFLIFKIEYSQSQKIDIV